MNKMRRSIIYFISVLLAIVNVSMIAFAGSWQSDDYGWWYQNDNGSYVKSDWLQDNGKFYFMGIDGYMLTDTVSPDGIRINGAGEAEEYRIDDNGLPVSTRDKIIYLNDVLSSINDGSFADTLKFQNDALEMVNLMQQADNIALDELVTRIKQYTFKQYLNHHDKVNCALAYECEASKQAFINYYPLLKEARDRDDAVLEEKYANLILSSISSFENTLKSMLNWAEYIQNNM